jgi:hypothetical protein
MHALHVYVHDGFSVLFLCERERGIKESFSEFYFELSSFFSGARDRKELSDACERTHACAAAAASLSLTLAH